MQVVLGHFLQSYIVQYPLPREQGYPQWAGLHLSSRKIFPHKHTLDLQNPSLRFHSQTIVHYVVLVITITNRFLFLIHSFSVIFCEFLSHYSFATQNVFTNVIKVFQCSQLQKYCNRPSKKIANISNQIKFVPMSDSVLLVVSVTLVI